VSNDVVRQRFTTAGLSPEFADAYIAMLATTVDRPALVTTEVEEMLTRPQSPGGSGCPNTDTCSPDR
jgi:hypothetical protein